MFSYNNILRSLILEQLFSCNDFNPLHCSDIDIIISFVISLWLHKLIKYLKIWLSFFIISRYKLSWNALFLTLSVNLKVIFNRYIFLKSNHYNIDMCIGLFILPINLEFCNLSKSKGRYSVLRTALSNWMI